MTLFEAFHRKKPSISHLHLFSRKCFIHIPEERHLPGSKLMPIEEEIFLEYTDTCSIYKVHIPTHSHTFIITTLNIKFEDTPVTAISCPEAEVTTPEVTTADVRMPNICSISSTTATLISFPKWIIYSMIDL